MHPDGTRTFRASIVARSRFVEDLVAEQAGRGLTQYVLLGAGLDTFVQRRPEVATRLRVFEVDRPRAQEWKRRRLIELGYGVPDGLRLVPDDFETDGSWWQKLIAAGFDATRPAVVTSLGVSMYLAREAGFAQVRHVSAAELNERYFSGRADGLRTSSGEELLVATT
jgi:methyltransferase (TIGR00027 family)